MKRPARSQPRSLLLGLLLLAGCGPKAGSTGGAERPAQVRYRPVEAPSEEARLFVDSVPDATWDAGLAAACQELLRLTTSRTAALDPETTSMVAARAGFPGQVRWSRVLNGGALPLEAFDGVAEAAGGRPVDLALARRTYEDGTSLWVLAWAPHLAELDPLPRDLSLDEPLALRVDLAGGRAAQLFVAPPGAPVEELSLTPGVIRWVDLFQVPGPYRVEVVAEGRGGVGEVALLFSVFVEDPPGLPPPLGEASAVPPDPHAAEEQLYAALGELRAAHGLPPVARFPLFEPVAREHSAIMASAGTVAHRIPGLSPGVEDRAADIAHPRAIHHESVAAAADAEDALAVVVDSPGHLRTLLCRDCTHAAIGAALEPVLDRPPRLFVTFELLRFPEGEPRPLQQWNRD